MANIAFLSQQTAPVSRTKSTSRPFPQRKWKWSNVGGYLTRARWRKWATKNTIICLQTPAESTMGTCRATIQMAGIAGKEDTRMVSINPENLIRASFISPSRVELWFADGLTTRRAFSQLEIDTSELRLETVRASTSGDALEVRTPKGHLVLIDSATIRALVDPDYAEKMTHAFLKLRGPLEDLDHLAVKRKLSEE